MGGIAIVSPKDENMQKVYEILKEWEEAELINKYTVYKQEGIPEIWHVKKKLSPNSIYLIAAIGYFFWNQHYEEILQNGNFSSYVDGYIELYSRTFFMAIGPNFKRDTHVFGEFQTIHVYPLLRNLLGWPEKENAAKMIEGMKELLKPIDDVGVEFEVREKKKYDVVTAVNGKSCALSVFEKMKESVKSYANSHKRAANTP